MALSTRPGAALSAAMSSATLDRSDVPVDARPAPPPAVVDRNAAPRAALFAQISAETAEWIAADLERRTGAGGGYALAAARIRRRAARYRAEAERLRVR